jgi:hypothetical protein
MAFSALQGLRVKQIFGLRAIQDIFAFPGWVTTQPAQQAPRNLAGSVFAVELPSAQEMGMPRGDYLALPRDGWIQKEGGSR